MAVFRSQFFDTKAYGNFIALAILLHKMCKATGYDPGAIVSTANKVTFDARNDLYKHLRASIGDMPPFSKYWKIYRLKKSMLRVCGGSLNTRKN